jgi:two-component system cell cycle response regulator
VIPDDLLAFLRQQKLPIPPELGRPVLKVLVVDDEPSVTAMIASELKAEFPEAQVLQAHDGFSAGELVGAELPDVVILDLRMPGMDGYEVCQRIKSRPATAHTVVVAMTAYPSTRAVNRILECGAQVCLTKPLAMDVLLKEVKSVVAAQ